MSGVQVTFGPCPMAYECPFCTAPVAAGAAHTCRGSEDIPERSTVIRHRSFGEALAEHLKALRQQEESDGRDG